MSETLKLKQFPVDQIELHIDRHTEPFWQAAAERRLIVPRCAQCKTYRFPPSARCPACHSEEVDWEEVSGQGTIYTFTVLYGGVPQSLNDYVPYAVVAVALNDVPVRIVANYVGETPEEVKVGLPVEVCWAEGDGITVPRFQQRQ
jgi:uncharacterized OB-fold protein